MHEIRVLCFNITAEFHFNAEYVGFPPIPFTPAWLLRRKVTALLKEGRYIPAIKWAHQHTSMDLRQARDYVIKIEDDMEVKDNA